ncbi:hypothetical protein G5B37_13765 [Rasiella rasia]|uniref:Anti-sigma factor n=1 Tax=Rasiella rasia TaxID=2744027 RepID=A0A6G6GPW5_9FLAO|nr:hypothetical protein [Rasiella rasia]QIE60592.1 hypothetical protein G5B37_13765 [Rasiella rasia]
MAQDIRELLRNRPETKRTMPEDHEMKFEKMLETHFPDQPQQTKRNASFFWLKVAAVAISFLAVSFFGYQYLSGLNGANGNNLELADTEDDTKMDAKDILKQPKLTLGDLSPDLKKVENFYLTGIDVQLASLETDDENKELIDGYMERISELNEEYNRLNNELTETGPTEATVNALIDNLKLRLDLLFKLKNKLKELKNLDNEKFNDLQA